MFRGILTITEDGCSQVTAGFGCQIITGVGGLTITVDGISVIITDGFGCREESGHATG